MENINTYKLHQTGPETQTILDQVNENTTDIAQLQDLYQAFIGSGVTIIQPTDTWPVANPEEKVIYRVIDRVNTPPESYSDYMWNGTAMLLMATYDNAIDPTPTAGSNNPVASGGVLDYVSTNGSAYDISAANSGTAYEDLAAALGTDGENVPEAVRKGGMSVKFVQTSDHKYVRFNYLKSSTANADIVNVDNWVGVDSKPVIGSKNGVESGGVAEDLYNFDNVAYSSKLTTSNISTTGEIVTASSYAIKTFQVSKDKKYKVTVFGKTSGTSSSGQSRAAFYTSTPTTGSAGTLVMTCDDVADYQTKSNEFVAPSDGYIAISYYGDRGDYVGVEEAIEVKGDYVSKRQQNLTSEEKKQIRENIGFGDGDIDDTPTTSSENLVKSGGVKNSIDSVQNSVNSIQGIQSKKTNFISSNNADAEIESVIVKTDSNEDVVIIDESGLKSKDYRRKNNQSILVPLDAMSDRVPNGAKTGDGTLNSIIVNDDNDSTVVRIDDDGIKAKDIQTLDGKSIIPEIPMGVNLVSRLGLRNAPEQSLVAFQNAYDAGYRVLLMDVRVTSDGYFVGVHDATINSVARNSDGTAISGDVSVEDNTLQTLNQYDWGIVKGSQFAGMKIPMVEDFIEFCYNRNCKFILEFKSTMTENDIIGLSRLVTKYNCDKLAVALVNVNRIASTDLITTISEKFPYSDLGIYANVSASLINDMLSWNLPNKNIKWIYTHTYQVTIQETIAAISDNLTALVNNGIRIGYSNTSDTAILDAFKNAGLFTMLRYIAFDNYSTFINYFKTNIL